jgi:hypothetical protein
MPARPADAGEQALLRSSRSSSVADYLDKPHREYYNEEAQEGTKTNRSQSSLGSERSGSVGNVRRGSTTSPDPGIDAPLSRPVFMLKRTDAGVSDAKG